MKLGKSRSTIRALALMLLASILTTCGDDKGSGSNEDRGVFGEMADALAQSEADFLTTNAEIFASVEYMQPYIAGLLDLSPGGSTGRPVQQSCLPAGIEGRTYTINGTPFTSVEDPTVPENTARFRLFRLSPAGHPLLNQDIGYVDWSCDETDQTMTVVRVFSDTTLTVSMSLEPSRFRNDLIGLMIDHAGDTLEFEGAHHTDPNLLTVTFKRDSLEANFECNLDFLHAKKSQFLIRVSGERVNKGELYVDSTRHVTQGLVIYSEAGIGHFAACLNTGTIEQPVFSSPSVDCVYGPAPIMQVTPSQLQAMSDSYRAVRALWLTTANLVEICRSLVPE